MAVIQMNFFSESLNRHAPLKLILPLPRRAGMPARELPCLTLLHGMGDDYSAWLNKTRVERFALEYGLAVVMPDGALSCYENMAHGERFRDYILDELPRVLRESFPLSAAREKNFIAGCSMGGFGALKLGFARPENYAAIGCFSAAHIEFQPPSPRNAAMLSRVYGGALDDFHAAIAADVARANRLGPDVRLYHAWGDRDVLRENALLTREYLRGLGPGRIEYRAEELPGRHDWALWDDMIARFIPMLGLERSAARLF